MELCATECTVLLKNRVNHLLDLLPEFFLFKTVSFSRLLFTSNSTAARFSRDVSLFILFQLVGRFQIIKFHMLRSDFAKKSVEKALNLLAARTKSCQMS